MIEHPINPPPELVAAWCREADDNEPMFPQVAAKAAEWGADQELNACCEWIPKATPWDAEQLRAARRPKPPIKGSTMTQDYNKPVPEYFSKQQDFDKPSPKFFRKQGNQWTPVDNTVPAEEEKQTSMTDLSPAAQAVLDANRSSHLTINNLAAALRAAALYCKRDRLQLIAIAEELEAQ